MKVPEASAHCDPEAKFNVLVAYDDVPAGQHAMRMIGNVERRIGEIETRYPSLWRFDLLKDPDWRIQATAEAIQADLLVISASGQSGLSGGVKTWLQTCLTQKKGTAAAVVALLGSGEHLDPPDSPRIQFLKGATEAVGLDFFAPGAD